MVNLSKKAGDGVGGIAEGDYTTWSIKHILDCPNGVKWYTVNSLHLDDRHDVMTLCWFDDGGDIRFARYDLSDLSLTFLSPAGEDYCAMASHVTAYAWVNPPGYMESLEGHVYTLQTYYMVDRFDPAANDHSILEIWRGTGSTPLWTHNIRTDVPAATWAVHTAMSTTGKYVGCFAYMTGKVLVYEGA